MALTTSGNIGSNVIEGREQIARTREAEQLEAAKLYGAAVRFLRYNDEGLVDSEQLRRDVLNAMRWADPDVIFTNFPGDMSTDHNVTGTVVSRMMLSLPGKNVPADEPPITKIPSLFYWDTGAGLHFEPEAYVDITDTMDEKLRVAGDAQEPVRLDEHLPGGEPHRSLPDPRASSAAWRSAGRYAEGFRAFRIHGYMPDFKLLP